MCCVIHFYGAEIEVDKVLRRLARQSVIAPYKLVRRGDTFRRGKSTMVAEQSSLSFDIPSEDFAHLSTQLPLIESFLTAHLDTLKTLAESEGVEYAYIDVAIQLRDTEQFLVQDQELSLAAIKLLAKIGLSFRVSLWANDSEDAQPTKVP